jgi:hypothetical protein
MDEKTRVHKDIIMFEDNIKRTTNLALTDAQKRIIELAQQYHQDAQYYSEKKEFFTAFGCVNYAHGLLDAILKTEESEEKTE